MLNEITENHFLAGELAKNMNIHIANFSNLKKKLNEYDYINLGQCTFIDKNAERLPKSIKNALNKYGYTNLYAYVPAFYMKSEYNLTSKELLKNGICDSSIIVNNKEFLRLTNIELLKKVLCTLNEEDFLNCKNDIIGYYKINKNKYFVYY